VLKIYTSKSQKAGAARHMEHNTQEQVKNWSACLSMAEVNIFHRIFKQIK
jgi:hypothetical protein